ncbi:MAG: methyltransferase domain-containing protein [Patescibacteria group bacterium]
MKSHDDLEAEKKQIGKLIETGDEQLFDWIRRRMTLALRIEEVKRELGEEIVRVTVESKRLDAAAQVAERCGLNPHFAQALLYLIIGESCKMQLMQWQGHHDQDWEELNEEQQYDVLKRNLLCLTEAIASRYDADYVVRPSATHIYLQYEKKFIRQQLQGLVDRSLAVDIGCATGHKTLKLLEKDFGSFQRVIGYDISPAMIQRAMENAKIRNISEQQIAFSVADMDEGISLPDSSVSFVLMNLGTAGDIRNITQLIQEVKRILIPGGRACFSFYNKEALLYQLGFLPWSVSLAAEIDLRRHYLNVHAGGQIYPVYARAYTVPDATNLVQRALNVTSATTYPTICSILPNAIFEGEQIVRTLKDVDHSVANLNLGAYILICAERNT